MYLFVSSNIIAPFPTSTLPSLLQPLCEGREWYRSWDCTGLTVYQFALGDYRNKASVEGGRCYRGDTVTNAAEPCLRP
jgi:hypothetical protein